LHGRSLLTSTAHYLAVVGVPDVVRACLPVVVSLRRGVGSRNRPFAALTPVVHDLFLEGAGSARWENIVPARGRPVVRAPSAASPAA